jgi:predicted Zn-dependent peptidase
MGVSHLLEHLVFKGTERRSTLDIALSLESVGGSLDAFTGREHTCFQARVLDEHLPIAVDVIGDLVFRPLLRQEDLDLERNVVLEEIGMVEDTPEELVFELHGSALWGVHPYGYSILGTRQSVSDMSIDDLRELHSKAYHPEQLVVAAAGNVEHAHLLDILASTGWLEQPQAGSARAAMPVPVTAPPVRSHTYKDSAQTHIVFGSTTVPYGNPDRYAIVLANLLLGGGMSSRLFQRVREELGLAYSVYCFQSFHEHVGLHGAYVGTSSEKAAQAEKVVRDEFAKVATQGLEPQEVAAGRTQLKGQLTLAMESVGARMSRAASVELYGERYRQLDEILKLIDAISDDQVRRVCAEFFDPDRQTVVSLGSSPAAT